MKMAFITRVFVLVILLLQTIALLVNEPKSVLYRHHNKVASYGNFKRYLYNYLAATKLLLKHP